MNLNDLLTGAWSPFTPLATEPALSNNPQTLTSLLTPQVQIPWASDDPTEPILSTSATYDPYAHFSDRAIDSGASPGSARLRRQFKIYMPCFPTERAIADRLQGLLRPHRQSQLPPSRIGYPAAEMAQNPSLPPRHLKTFTPLSPIGYPTAGMSRDQPRPRRQLKTLTPLSPIRYPVPEVAQNPPRPPRQLKTFTLPSPIRCPAAGMVQNPPRPRRRLKTFTPPSPIRCPAAEMAPLRPPHREKNRNFASRTQLISPI